MLRIPSKLGIDGAAVEGEVAAGNLRAVSDYCETDVIATYLLYLRYAFQTECLDVDGYNAATSEVAQYLAEHGEDRPHLAEYLTAWSELGGPEGLMIGSKTMGMGTADVSIAPADAEANEPRLDGETA
jgi:hypothetical protein